MILGNFRPHFRGRPIGSFLKCRHRSLGSKYGQVGHSESEPNYPRNTIISTHVYLGLPATSYQRLPAASSPSRFESLSMAHIHHLVAQPPFTSSQIARISDPVHYYGPSPVDFELRICARPFSKFRNSSFEHMRLYTCRLLEGSAI